MYVQFKELRNVVVFHGPLVLWMGVIFYLSAQKGSQEQYYDLWMFMLRKGAHIAEYIILYFFWVRSLKKTMVDSGLVWLYAAIFSFAFALSDEFHQLFVYGREGKISDVAIDLVGIIIGFLAMKKISSHKKKSA